MSCPHQIKSNLPPMLKRIAKLPIAANGFVVPFFVASIDGKPDFRVADPEKLITCVRNKLCWVCGEPLGVHIAFVIGPMCVVNRVSSDPPTHQGCAEWSVKACPFLSKPKMERRKDEKIEAMIKETPAAGIMIERNPGVTTIYTTRSFKLERVPNGILFRIGPPEALSWWREGREATRDEVLESINTGLPALKNECSGEEDLKSLAAQLNIAMKLIPQ